MRLSGYQPQYFPRLHYFNRALNSDVFEISNYVQFVKKHAFVLADGTSKRGESFQADCPIKIDSGILNLTIPIHNKLLPINKTEIDYSLNWPYKHLQSLKTAFNKSVNFSQFFPELEQIIEEKY